MSKPDNSLALPDWLLSDNQNRTAAYARDINDETFLRAFNDYLKKEKPQLPKEINHPVIFFFGVPRCGKTFFSQVLNHCFDLGYPDNLIARFWRAPYFGIRLSKLLRAKFETQSNFQSDFGKTNKLFDPHDFAYFWHEHLLKDSHPYDFMQKKAHINWAQLEESLAVFTQTFQKACLFKGVNPSYHLSEIVSKIPNTFFIYIERDFIDAGISLARARQKNYNNLKHWYGQNPSPEEYEKIKNLDWPQQIARQFKWLNRHYENELSKIDENRYLRVNYKDFCSAPQDFFNQLQDAMQENFDAQLKQKNDLSEVDFHYSQHAENEPYYKELKAAFEKIQLAIRTE